MQKNMGLTISNRIENLNSKLALYKVKSILLKEFKNPYYENAAHIQKIIDLNETPIEEIDGTLAYHMENILIWRNDWISFSNHYVTTPALRYSKRKVS